MTENYHIRTKAAASKTGAVDYRFGFNGQMKVNEMAGIGNHYTAQFWEYDTRIGRRWDTDPVKVFSQSSYAAFNNNPILNTDHLGNVGEPVVDGNTLTIRSHMLFYGGAATPELANQAAKNIQAQWSNGGTVTYKGKEYNDVKFVVTHEVVSEKLAQSRANANKGGNYDPQLNFARIESRKEVGNNANRVSGRAGKAGDNSMYLLAEDIYSGNTSQSHEMGHGFGIMRHIGSYERFRGVPRIMTTIHTAVDGAYTIDGEDGIPQGAGKIPLHPLNPDKRQVTQQDLNEININSYKSGIGSGSRVGASSNDLFHKDGQTAQEKGSPIVK